MTAPPPKAQLQSPDGLAVDGADNLYIADQENALIRIVDSAGIIRTL
jgi:sugar lactone lactonase YvrE